MKSQPGESRLRAWLQFTAALIWYFVAHSMAHRGALVLAADAWQPVAEILFLAFFLVFGYSGLGSWLNGQHQAISEQGLALRKGWKREAGLGMVIGWALALCCVLPLALAGGIAVSVSMHWNSWGWLPVEIVFFALLALAEEVAFRGFGFQRFVQATGPLSASLVFAVIFALVQAQLSGSNAVSFLVAMALNLCLSLAYLRTRALWVSWGLNFAWKASRALLFGLAVCGNNQHSPVVQGDPMGAFWMTGGGFGLDGSRLALIFLLFALPVIYKATRELDFIHNAPVFEPGGYAVDLSQAGQKMHNAAMGPAAAPAAPTLVQILPAVPMEPSLVPLPTTLDKSEATTN